MEAKDYSTDEVLVTDVDGSEVEAEHESSENPLAIIVHTEQETSRRTSGVTSKSRDVTPKASPVALRPNSVEDAQFFNAVKSTYSSEDGTMLPDTPPRVRKLSDKYFNIAESSYASAFLSNQYIEIGRLYEVYHWRVCEFKVDGSRLIDYPYLSDPLLRTLMLCGGLSKEEMNVSNFIDRAITYVERNKVHFALQFGMPHSISMKLGGKIKYPALPYDDQALKFQSVKYDVRTDVTRIAVDLIAFDIMHKLGSVSDITEVFKINPKSNKCNIAGFKLKGRAVIKDVVRAIGREFHDWLGILHLMAIDIKTQAASDIDVVNVWNIMDVINFLYVGYNRAHRGEDKLVQLSSVTKFLNEDHDITNRSRVRFDRVFKPRVEELIDVVFGSNGNEKYSELMKQIDKGREKFSEFLRK